MRSFPDNRARVPARDQKAQTRRRVARRRQIRFETLELRALLTTVPEAGQLSAELFGGDLWIADQQGSLQQNQLTLENAVVEGRTYLRLHDAAAAFSAVPSTTPASFFGDNQHTIFIPTEVVSGALRFHGGGAEDTLRINLASGNVIPAGGILFHGDLPAAGAGDLLIIEGGSQGVVTYNYLNASDGDIVLGNYGTITYEGLEPIINTGTATDVIFNLPATTNNVTLVDDGIVGNGLSRLSGGTFETTDFTNPIGSLTINRGSASDTITTGGLSDLSASLLLGSAANPFAALTFDGALTLVAGKDLVGFASGTIGLPSSNSDLATGGAGTISLTTAQNIFLAAGASLTTVDGAVTLSANQQMTPTAAPFVGVEIAGLVRSTGAGNVVVTGRGGGTGASLFGYGVAVTGSGEIASSGAGAVTVTGTGGNGGGADYGVLVSGAAARIGTAAGNVSVSGTGGSLGSSNHGVLVNHSARIEAGGSGSATVTGVGGGSGDSNVGVLLAGGFVVTGGGAVNVTGTGGSGATRNDGVVVSSVGRINTVGTGLITVIGNAAGNNLGVIIQAAGAIETSGGSVSIAGPSFALANSSSYIKTLGAGSLTIAADRMTIDATTTIDVGPNTAIVKTRSASQAIDIGGADSATSLGLTDAELDRFTAGTLVFGNADSAGLDVTGFITRSAATNIVLRPGSAATISAGHLHANGGSVVVDNPAFTFRPQKAAVDVYASTLSFTAGSKVLFAINGLEPSVEFTQLTVQGDLNLTGSELVVNGSYVPTTTDSFYIINNLGTFPTSGTFAGLPEGSVLTVNGTPMRITYVGGTGNNDVMLLPHNRPPTITSDGGGATASKTVFTGTSPLITTVTATDVDLPAPTFTYSLSGGADAARFTIDSSTGALRFVSPPNFSAPSDANRDNVYDVTVRVGDGLGGFDTQAISVTVNNLIPVTGQRDLIYDASRNQLLATTGTGSLLRYDRATNTWLSPLTVGTSLNGGDITADGNFVYVTEASTTGGRKIHKVNLSTGAVTNLPYTESYSLETGGWDLAIAANNTALFTPLASNTSVSYFDLRQIDLNTDVISSTAHADIFSGAHLDRSANRNLVLLRQPNWTSHAVTTYSPAGGFSAPGGADDDQATGLGAVNRDGSLLAMEAYASVGLYDSNVQAKIYFESFAGGHIFHPTLDILLAVDADTNQLVAFDTNTLQEKYRLAIGEDVGVSTPLGAGVMSISADGKDVYLSTAAGIRVLTLPSETGPAYTVEITDYSTWLQVDTPSTVQVTVRNQAGNIATDYVGTVQFASMDATDELPESYTFTAADQGQHTFTLEFATTGNKYVTVTDVDQPIITDSTDAIFSRNTPTQFIRIDDIRDLIFDPQRNLLYATTGTGRIERYDPATDSLLPPFQAGWILNGADLSLDGNNLYAKEERSLAREAMVRKVNLDTGAVTTLSYLLEDGESGGTDIGITADGLALLTGRYAGSGSVNLRRLDTANDTISVIDLPGGSWGNIGMRAQVTPSPDRSFLLVNDDYTTDNMIFTYSTGGVFSPIQHVDGSEMAAISPNGSLIAQELGTKVVIYDRSFNAIHQFPDMGGGLIFHPTQPILFIADDNIDYIRAFDTNTWEERYRFRINENIAASRPFIQGEMEISADGKQLFLTSSVFGLRMYSLPQANQVPTSFTISDFGNTVSTGVVSSVTITMRDPAGNPVTNYTGTIQFTSTDPSAVLPANYTFTAADNGRHTFTYQMGTGGNQTLTVKDVAQPALTTTSTAIQVAATPAAFLPLPGAREFVYDSTRNLMYIIMASGEIQRYSYNTNSLLSPWKISDGLAGGDISVDNSALYVNNNLPNVTQSIIHKIDLATGNVTDLISPHIEGHYAGWDLKISADGVAHGIVTESHFSDLSMQQINTATDVISGGLEGYVNVKSQAARNTNRSLLTFIVDTSTAGEMFTYNAFTHTYSSYVRTNVGLGNAFFAVNDAASFVAVGLSNKVEIRNASLALTATISGPGGDVAFKPGTNLLFVADKTTERINVYNGDTGWNKITSLYIGEDIISAVLGEGNLGFSSDGSKLMLITATGVRLFEIGELVPPTVSGIPSNQSLPEGTPTAALPFVVGDNATPVGELQLFGRSSSSSRVPQENIFFGGSGANRTVTVQPDLDQFGSATITVTVIDRYRNATDFTFTMTTTTVNDPPTFVAGPNQSVAYGAGPQTVNGWATSIWEGAANEVAQTVSFQITGNTNSTLFSTQPAVSATGVLTYTPAAGQFGTATVTVTPVDSGGASGAPHALVINVGAPTLFSVASFTATKTGFVVDFNQPIDHTTLHLYDSPDIILTRNSTAQSVRGSVAIDPGLKKLTFVATDGLLPPDTYWLRLRSGADAFHDTALTALDGDRNGLAGGDFVQNFAVSAPNGISIGLPNIVRGPGQDVNFPVSGTTGIPLSFGNGGGLIHAGFSIRFDADFLNVTGATLAPGLPLGTTLSYTQSQPGLITIEVDSPEPFPAGTTRFVDLQASVPTTAIYRQKNVLDIFGIDLRGVATGIDDDAMQVVAFFGDITGNGTYSAQDAAIVSQFATGIVTALEGYRLADPLLIGDITGNGTFSSVDTALLLQASVGMLPNEIPGPLPPHTLLQGGPDPKLSIPQNLTADAGQSLKIPVEIDSIVDLTGTGLTSADLVIYFDPKVLDVTSVALGQLVSRWAISSRIDSLTGRIDISLAGPNALNGKFRGELVQLQATVKTAAPAGVSAINLAASSRSRATQLNEGFLTLIPAPTDSANDAIDGRITVRASNARPTTTSAARLVGEQLVITGSAGDDRILVGTLADGQLRVRVGSQLLGDFEARGVAIDGFGGNDYIYVAPSAPPALIRANIADNDLLFGGDSLLVTDSDQISPPAAAPASAFDPHELALLQLLSAWQVEHEETDGTTLRRRTAR